jgi:hypothetical protein
MKVFGGWIDQFVSDLVMTYDHETTFSRRCPVAEKNSIAKLWSRKFGAVDR